jgi:hypothetical protein
MENFVVPVTFLVLGLSQVSMMIYYWHFGRQIKQLGKVEGTGFDSEEMGWKSLRGAIKKGQAIVGEAELESIKGLAVSSQQLEKLEKSYSHEMEVTSQDVQKQLKVESAKATEAFKAMLSEQTKVIKELSLTVDATVKENIEGMLMKFGKDLSDKLAELESKSLAAADLEVSAMKKTVSEYQKRRMEKIDDEIVEIVDRTVSLFDVQKQSFSSPKLPNLQLPTILTPTQQAYQTNLCQISSAFPQYFP